tara:strand:+ start:602 stop:1180 length:579 start_codon:yes stop_codon:yes gene_type:complete
MDQFISNPFGRLTVLTGPSGVGKGAVVNRFLEIYSQVWLSISATTRAPREGEIDGVHYFFLDKQSFLDLINQKGFLEWAEFAGNFYGTPSKGVNERLSEGKPVLLEIELEGARQIKKTFPDASLIFLAPPSMDELERRIRGRGTESENSINRRLIRAKEELEAQQEFDSIIVNEDVNKASLELASKMNLSTN